MRWKNIQRDSFAKYPQHLREIWKSYTTMHCTYLTGKRGAFKHPKFKLIECKKSVGVGHSSRNGFGGGRWEEETSLKFLRCMMNETQNPWDQGTVRTDRAAYILLQARLEEKRRKQRAHSPCATAAKRFNYKFDIYRRAVSSETCLFCRAHFFWIRKFVWQPRYLLPRKLLCWRQACFYRRLQTFRLLELCNFLICAAVSLIWISSRFLTLNVRFFLSFMMFTLVHQCLIMFLANSCRYR